MITKLKTPRNEVVVLHLLGKNELEFDYKGSLTFEDLETGARIKIDAKEAKTQYLASLEKSIKATKETMLANAITYQLLRLEEQIGEALQLLLKKRNNLM